MKISTKAFGEYAGKPVHLFRIENASGAAIELTDYGATLLSAIMPDKNNSFADVLVGFDTLQGYLDYSSYQGQTVGRYANRIADGRFSLDGTVYELDKNENNITCLHSSGEFSCTVWDYSVLEDGVAFSLVSPDGTHGFPGEVTAEVTFTLTQDNSISIVYSAVSSKKTVFSFTNHAYFNLGGYASGNILGHILQINADCFTPMTAESIPTGELRAVAGTPFDFNTPKAIGRDIGEDYEQLKLAGGYDHNFCLRKSAPGEPCITAFEPVSGRTLEVFTDLPGVQLYTGNFLKGEPGKKGLPLVKHAGFCLETQVYPDSPNQQGFPNCVYDAGERYETRTVYKFACRS